LTAAAGVFPYEGEEEKTCKDTVVCLITSKRFRNILVNITLCLLLTARKTQRM